MSGYFASLYEWTQETGYGFYEPYATDFGRYNDAGTFTVAVDAEVEGFSFDVLHTSQFLANELTSNNGPPNIVVQQLSGDARRRWLSYRQANRPRELVAQGIRDRIRKPAPRVEP